MKTLKDLTQQQIDKILTSDMKDTYMRYGYEVTRHCDTTLTLVDIFTIKGQTELFDDVFKVEEKCKQLFIEEVENNPNRCKGSVWLIGHVDLDRTEKRSIKYTYEGGLQGIGQSMGYMACANYKDALWFNSLDEVCEYLKHYCYNDEAVLISLYKGWLYEQITGKRLL